MKSASFIYIFLSVLFFTDVIGNNESLSESKKQTENRDKPKDVRNRWDGFSFNFYLQDYKRELLIKQNENNRSTNINILKSSDLYAAFRFRYAYALRNSLWFGTELDPLNIGYSKLLGDKGITLHNFYYYSPSLYFLTGLADENTSFHFGIGGGAVLPFGNAHNSLFNVDSVGLKINLKFGVEYFVSSTAKVGFELNYSLAQISLTGDKAKHLEDEFVCYGITMGQNF